MISSASANSGRQVALLLLQSGQGDKSTQNNKADDVTEYKLYSSTISEFGEHKLGGLWIPDLTIRTAELSGGGQRAIAGGDVIIYGTDKRDIVTTGHESYVDGGSGDDRVEVRENSVAFGSDGDDTVVGTFNSVVSGGAGNDWSIASWNSVAFGDEGDDEVTAYYDSEAYGGEGNDTLTAVVGSFVDGGEGDDTMVARGAGNIVVGGTGNDTLNLVEAQDTTVRYAAGDGDDKITLGDERHLSRSGEAPKTTLDLAPNISAENTRIQVSGNQAVISFSGSNTDRITINFTGSSSLTIAFADGTSQEINWAPTGGFQPAAASTAAKYLEF